MMVENVQGKQKDETTEITVDSMYGFIEFNNFLVCCRIFKSISIAFIFTVSDLKNLLLKCKFLTSSSRIFKLISFYFFTLFYTNKL